MSVMCTDERSLLCIMSRCPLLLIGYKFVLVLSPTRFLKHFEKMHTPPLRSGDWLGHSRTLMCFFLSHSFVALAVCFGSLSCWNTHPQPISMPWPWWYMAPSIIPLMRCSCPGPLAEKHPQSIMFPPPCLTVGMVFLGSWAAFLLLQTRRVELMPKSSILVSSNHNTFTQFSSESFRCSLANFRRACTCAFLSRGTLRALQDFSPSRRSVLPIVFLVTMVPAALRSLTRSSRVVLGWFLTVLHEVRSCMEPQSEGDNYFVSSICK